MNNHVHPAFRRALSAISPTQQAELTIVQMSRVSDYKHGARVMDISRAIGRDPTRLAYALREAPADLMADFCAELIAAYPGRPALAMAVTKITNVIAKDQA